MFLGTGWTLGPSMTTDRWSAWRRHGFVGASRWCLSAVGFMLVLLTFIWPGAINHKNTLHAGSTPERIWVISHLILRDSKPSKRVFHGLQCKSFLSFLFCRLDFSHVFFSCLRFKTSGYLLLLHQIIKKMFLKKSNKNTSRIQPKPESPPGMSKSWHAAAEDSEATDTSHKRPDMVRIHLGEWDMKY